MKSPTFSHERALTAAGHTPIGIDEAGCGCLAGPVVAAALYLPLNSRIGDLRDSKLLSETQRERLASDLSARGATWTIGVATHEEIDRMNIRRATYLAMRRALEAFITAYAPAQPHALVDAWTIPNLSVPQRGIVHGDRLVKSIAAASIVAKVTRDRMMDELDGMYPAYGFARHKGYATEAHRTAIAQYGISPIHRRTFYGQSLMKIMSEN